jgi:Caspase domain
MSLVFDNVRPSTNQTHALIIGVGDYPNLKASSLVPATAVAQGLGNLSSPPLSAKAVADWMIKNLQTHPTKPLGSVELLISPSPGNYQFSPATTAVAVEVATFQHIADAFDRWYQRSEQSAGNLAIFYFCGHGLERSSTVLLPEDFAASPNRPWRNTIDFDGTHVGMAECPALSQLYLLDCCRDSNIDIIQVQPFDPATLKTTNLLQFPQRDAYVLRAAAVGAKAHAPRNSVSLFTRCLLRCLDNLAAESFDGSRWKITTDSLCLAMKRLLPRTPGPRGVTGTCSIGGESHFATELHHLPDPVQVMAEVLCDPVAALGTAHLAVLQNGSTVASRPPDSNPWQFELPSGQNYELEAQFATGTYRNKTLSGQLVVPPVFSRTLNV